MLTSENTHTRLDAPSYDSLVHIGLPGDISRVESALDLLLFHNMQQCCTSYVHPVANAFWRCAR